MALAVLWRRSTSMGLISGCISGIIKLLFFHFNYPSKYYSLDYLTGLFVGVFTWFLVNISEGEEITLVTSTAIDPLLAGNISSLVTSLLVTLAVSAAATRKVSLHIYLIHKFSHVIFYNCARMKQKQTKD